MAAHTIAAATTHLHGYVVDVQLCAVRGSNGKLHILVGRIVLSLHPCAAIAGTD